MSNLLAPLETSSTGFADFSCFLISPLKLSVICIPVLNNTSFAVIPIIQVDKTVSAILYWS